MTLGREADKVAADTMRRAAPFALSAIQQSSRTAKPYRPYASGTYERGWMIMRTAEGAAVVNTAKHSAFVEMGRRPGKRPPKAQIEAWVRHKRFGKPSRKRRRPSATPPTKRGKTKRGKTKRGRRPASRFRGMDDRDADAFVEAVRWKIAHKGTPARWVVKRAMPKIRRHVLRELNKSFAQLLASGPR